MKWFRRNIRTGSRLALFALAVQCVLSFGHVHFDAARAAPAIQTGLSQTDFASTQGPATEATNPARPSGHDKDHPANEPCAICAVMSMANHVLFATPALLLLPDAVEFLYLTTDAEFAHLGSLWSAFQSRAPPVS
jgi:Protein of unknown function (DUF2946)